MSDDPVISDRELEEAAGVGGAGPALPSLPVRYLQVFVSPGPLFERLKHRPVWFVTLLASAALVGLGTFMLPADLMLSTMREQAMASGRPTPDFGEGARWFRIGSVVIGPLFYMLFTVLAAGIVMGIFNFLFGEEGSFRQYLSILAHANLIVTTSAVLLAPLRVAAEDPRLLLSLGTFMPFLGDGWLAGFFGLLDLFGLWSWVIVGLGVSKMTRTSWKTATIVVMIFPLAIAAIGAFFR